jgi:hypothetical protein
MDRHFKHHAASLRDNPISAFGKQSERGLAAKRSPNLSEEIGHG